ncbi:unnamed protein product [Rangifer tarandus platyrhynchus]|uniref:Uncharacterized protein n=1 Tax=Rangifer tarandus platyrhynchus TaxID=3082113 RepID=A0AC59Y835_RANTA
MFSSLTSSSPPWASTSISSLLGPAPDPPPLHPVLSDRQGRPLSWVPSCPPATVLSLLEISVFSSRIKWWSCFGLSLEPTFLLTPPFSAADLTHRPGFTFYMHRPVTCGTPGHGTQPPRPTKEPSEPRPGLGQAPARCGEGPGLAVGLRAAPGSLWGLGPVT